MSLKLCRRRSVCCFGLLVAVTTVLLCVYYVTTVGENEQHTPEHNHQEERTQQKAQQLNAQQSKVVDIVDETSSLQKLQPEPDTLREIHVPPPTAEEAPHEPQCPVLRTAPVDIRTGDQFASFDFQPAWMKTKEFWDHTLESRYASQRNNATKPPVHIIIVPHSHNDPGWLKTYSEYFQYDTRQILDNVISQMHQFTDMTFIWSEISFLQPWWDQANAAQRKKLRQLIDQGRFEITTGGWVMTDEAAPHVYAMVDQLIEGHQWCRTHLNYTPTTGWSVDPFGHGSTVPYLLAASGFEGAIIQRIHYAWKRWLAEKQQGDFVWTPAWQHGAVDGKQRPAGALLTHNMPYDLYSIKHSCGPHAAVCLNFDYYKKPGEYTDARGQTVTDANVELQADLLMEQYARTASMFTHNVALIPLGDDFRYNYQYEMEQQYTNYKRLIEYVRKHPERYGGAQIGFGVPRDYFREIEKREAETGKFPSLSGDFFAYGDVYVSGKPAYWTGYFATRPSYKLLSRELEANLRATELLFTVAFNRARQLGLPLGRFERGFVELVAARRNLGLFQHHDAITGTSKDYVMQDYGNRLFGSVRDVVRLQERAIEVLLQPTEAKASAEGFVSAELERKSFDRLPRQRPIEMEAAAEQGTNFVVYNSLAQSRLEVVRLRSPVPNVEVLDASTGERVAVQVGPVWDISGGSGYSSKMEIRMSQTEFEVLFVARLAATSLRTFTLRQTAEQQLDRRSTVYCADCSPETGSQAFRVRASQPGDIDIENAHMNAVFNGSTGFLKSVQHKNATEVPVRMQFAAYRSAKHESGAYLFKPERTQTAGHGGFDILALHRPNVRIVVSTGPLASEVRVVYGPLLVHTVRLFRTQTALDRALQIDNDVNFEAPPKNYNTEMFMRVVTELANGEEPERPVFYTDQNGFQFHRREKVPALGAEGNYYPITTAAFMQDKSRRLTLLTTHAQAAASLRKGEMEVMLDRRTVHHDSRGLGEGVLDSRLTRHRFWLLVEEFAAPDQVANDPEQYELPSAFANQLSNGLNYPAAVYFVGESTENSPLRSEVRLLSEPLPCDVHLMTLRTLSDPEMPAFPAASALMVLQRQGRSCRALRFGADADGCANEPEVDESAEAETTKTSAVEGVQLFEGVSVERVRNALLTGLGLKEEVKQWSEVQLEPMEMRTLSVSFAEAA